MNGGFVYAGGFVETSNRKDFIIAAYDFILNPLPLNFLSITAQKCAPQQICVTWKTANEQNVSHFEIERSIDGIAFELMNNIAAKNQPSNSYTFIDNRINNAAKKYYYRVKQIDVDGKFKYSPIALIHQNTTTSLSIYPNPTTAVINISNWLDIKNISLYNITGKLVQQWDFAQPSLNIAELLKGVYVLKITLKDGETVVQKINKL
ncbi:MAG: T9SS type A sorting domain-containing protein [Ferruginibacter sp.]